MKYAGIVDRLAGLGGAKWDVHFRARQLAEEGRDIIELTIGEPDVPAPEALTEVAIDALRRGRTGYSNGPGEDNLRAALAQRYAQSTNTPVTPEQILCFPGTQTALFAVLMGVAEAGDEVLVGDPMYATYEGVIRASGAAMVPVPLSPAHGFRIRAEDIATRITPRSRAILLNTPHNPTGALLTRDDLAAIGELARQHDLWIISDEVYEEMVFDGETFQSPLSIPGLADRVVVVSSISKSHAAPGFRSGWAVGPAEFAARLLPLSETMLFGNQPFIADMTAVAVSERSEVARGMRKRFASRAALLKSRLGDEEGLEVHQPKAGMFALINVAGTGMTGDEYANHLLLKEGVAVMPGSAFGAGLENWVRVALTVDDARFDRACERIIAHARRYAGEPA
ncbi:pyridoxal phosphate-dependent aminotransferase [Sulfitobacter aestuarii]|uniref:aspartate transaminase n=1 Tax=Sulfitobacter aestuarii TaxID=2161676 RepID=A0ABW5U461_9RHOB